MMLRWIIAAPALALWFVWYAIASIGHRKMHKREPFTGPGNYPRITPPSRPAPPRWPR